MSPSDFSLQHKTSSETAQAFEQPRHALARTHTEGGSPIDTSQPAFPVYHRKLADPSVTGLLSVAGTLFIASLYFVRARGVTSGNVILGMALAHGGLCQFVAGVMEWAVGNTFASAVYMSYGSFWISYACLLIPQFGIRASFAVESEYESALGLYLSGWVIITTLFLIASLRSSVALVALFVFLELYFVLLMAAHFTSSAAVACTTAGGACGIISSLISFYIALANLLTKDTSYFLLPLGDLTPAKKAEHTV